MWSRHSALNEGYKQHLLKIFCKSQKIMAKSIAGESALAKELANATGK